MASGNTREMAIAYLSRGDHFSIGNYHYVVLSNDPLKVRADSGEKPYVVLKVTKCLTNGTINTRELRSEEMIFLETEVVDLHIPVPQFTTA